MKKLSLKSKILLWVTAIAALGAVTVLVVILTTGNGTTPERTIAVHIDISNYNDNRLNIKIEDLGGGEWRTYEYGGGSVKDAFNSR